MATVKFNNSIKNDFIDHLIYDFGDGTTLNTTDQTVYHNYLVQGNYTYTLRAFTDSSSYQELSYPIIVNGFPPDASFMWFVDGSNVKQINFYDVSLRVPTRWDWTWGDGSANGSSQNPFHIYSDYTTSYPVTLTARNYTGSDSTTINVLTGTPAVRYFNRPDYFPAIYDNYSSSVHLSRGSDEGLFNSVTESSFNVLTSPVNTLWSQIFDTPVGDPRSITYKVWNEAIKYPTIPTPTAMVGRVIYMKIISENRFFEIHFTNWTVGAGGGINYVRYEV